jgi:hypothetical protein
MSLLLLKASYTIIPHVFSLIGDGRDHRQLVPGSANSVGLEGLCFGLVATAKYVRVYHGLLVTPVNVFTRCFGAFGHRRVLLIEPVLDGFGALLVGQADGLLRCEAPELEVFAHAAYWQFDAKRLPHQQKHRSANCQRKRQLQLLGAVLASLALDVLAQPKGGAAGLARGPLAWGPVPGCRQFDGTAQGTLRNVLDDQPFRCCRTACLRLSCCAYRNSLRPSSLSIHI